jgi:PAS domain S-box-containing protein
MFQNQPDREAGNMQMGEKVEEAKRLAREQRVHPLWATFRNILLVVFLIFVFAVVQMLVLRRVCDTGMMTAESLEQQGLPTLNVLASLQEHLAVFRLNSYEYLFAREEEKTVKAKAVETVAAQTQAELEHIKELLPEGEGRRLASNLEVAVDDLRNQFRTVRGLVDSDFAAAMKAMDQDGPAKAGRVAAAAAELKAYVYRFSGAQANATFGSFGWIKQNAVVFGAANIFVALGAVVFILLAARHSRAQLADTLARLDERSQELVNSLSVVNATLESTVDGIMLIDLTGKIETFNRQFVRMWGIADPVEVMQDRQRLLTLVLPLLKQPRKFADKVAELANEAGAESYDVVELKDERVFECSSKPHRIGERICGRVWSTRDISEQKRMQREVEQTHRQLLQVSRQAGMSEVATSVLHNVGNVLNSVNVSTTLVIGSLAKSKITNVARLGELLTQNADNLAAFLSTDARGLQLPAYVNQLAEHLNLEREDLLKECQSIRANVEHINEIVAMQQNYAKTFAVVEKVKVRDLVEDALRMNEGALTRHVVEVVRDYEPPDCEITVEKHKVLQILINLIGNAKYACDESDRDEKRITVRFRKDQARVQIEIADNGIGIPTENMTRIFNDGFSTRKNGHGFGLHNAANAARELGGSLVARSEGLQRGACFLLELPLSPPSNSK